jgi:uncharacterized damage-inducible protein DinB
MVLPPAANENPRPVGKMSGRIPWTERQFDFSFPAALFPEIIERLRGTPARLEDRITALPPEILTRRDGDRWSVQENAGHLLDLETLFTRRVDEYAREVPTLHAADMSNRKTYEGNHNQRLIAEILTGFRKQRGQLTDRLDGFEPAMFARSAIHPRLNVSMRLVDMLFFQAEHDDYHLTRISELIRLFAG